MSVSFEGEIKELKIPVPWGHIAAKSWGDQSKTSVLVFHGRLDNAGAFDNLIPLLSNRYNYICFDLPSHGQSSHFPAGTPIYTTNFLLAYTYIMKYFKQKTYTVIGHSYGGHIGFLYARLYPDRINKLVMIDTVHYDPVHAGEFSKYILNKYEFHVKLMEKLSSGKQPVYTYEQAKERISNNRENDPLNDAAATALLNRGLKEVGDNKFVYTVDQRMKNYFDLLHDFRYAIEDLEANPIICPTLLLLGNRNTRYHNLFKPALEVFKKWDHVNVKYVNGDHDVHNKNPENVAPFISKFLLEESTVKKFIPQKPNNLRWFSKLLHMAKL